MRIRIQQLFSWTRIQLKKLCNKLNYEEFSGVEKEKNDCLKYKTKKLVKIYFSFITITVGTTGTNFLPFSVFFLKKS